MMSKLMVLTDLIEFADQRNNMGWGWAERLPKWKMELAVVRTALPKEDVKWFDNERAKCKAWNESLSKKS